MDFTGLNMRRRHRHTVLHQCRPKRFRRRIRLLLHKGRGPLRCVLQGFGITDNAYGGRGTCLDGNHHRFVGQEAARTFAEKLETLAEAFSHKLGIQKWSGEDTRPGL